MSNIMSPHRGFQTPKKDQTLSELLEYEKYYMQLIKEYQPEITAIEEMLKSLRKERTDFFDNLQKIEEAMVEDDVLSYDSKRKWLEQYHESMIQSFKISEEIINHFVTKNLNEFRQEMILAKEKV